jgi:hypothetical protein
VTEPIEIEFEVACSPEHAFDTWANRTSMWWPPSHSMSSAPGLVVTFEPRPGGRIYERTPEGAEHDWGEVLAWEPPPASPTSGTWAPGVPDPDPPLRAGPGSGPRQVRVARTSTASTNW